MNRFLAAAAHFGLSMLVVGAAFVLVYFLWYPEPLFRGAGGRDLFLVLALVDVTLGPLVTMLVFKPGKPGLKFDLATIAVLQLAALAYGTHVLFEARPVWIVFLKDRFDVIRANQVVELEGQPPMPPFMRAPLTGPRIAGARIPTDPQERYRTMLSALAGADVSSYPHYYVAYGDIAADAAAKARPLRVLRELNPGRDADIAALVRGLGDEESRIGFLPVRAGKRDLSALVDARSGRFLGVADLRPWTY